MMPLTAAIRKKERNRRNLENCILQQLGITVRFHGSTATTLAQGEGGGNDLIRLGLISSSMHCRAVCFAMAVATSVTSRFLEPRLNLPTAVQV